MTNPKAYLERVLKAEKELRDLKQRVNHYEDLGLNITSHMSDAPVSHSMGSSRVETSAVGMIDTMSTINANLRAYEAIVREAEKLIDKIPQERYRRILKLRYLCDMSFRSIGDELRYTDRNSVYRAHGYALVEMGRVLDEDGIGQDEEI